MPTLILLGYILALVIAVVFSVRKESKKEFMIANREVGAFALMTSIVGNLRDGAGIAAWVALSAYFGFGALWLTAGLCAGLALMAVWAARLRKLAIEKDYVSVTQLVSDSIGPKTARLSSIVISVTALLYAAAQLFVAGSLSASLFGLPSSGAIIVVGLIVFAYLIMGGYRATILTGMVQWFVLLIILFLPFMFFQNSPEAILEPASFFGIEPLTAFGFFAISFLVVISSADIWQLIFASKSGQSARKGLIQSIICYIPLSVAMVFFGLACVAFVGQGIPPNDAFLEVLTSPQIPQHLSSLIGVFVLAALMSTLDSQVFLFASTLIKEFKPSFSSDGPEFTKYTRYGITAAMLALVFIAVQVADLVEFLFSAVTLGTVLVPVFVYSLIYNTKTDKVWLIALSVGVIVYAVMFAKNSFANVGLTIVPAAVTTIVAVTLLVLKRERAV